MLLEIQHSGIANRSCEHCQIFHYNEETGEPYEGRGGGFAKRHKGCPPPCRTDVGCPKGTPEDSKELSKRNRQVIHFYRECSAVNSFPDDAIVRQNAAIIESIKEAEQRKHQAEISAMLKGLTGATNHS